MTNTPPPPLTDEELLNFKAELHRQDQELQVIKDWILDHARRLNEQLEKLVERWGDVYYERYGKGETKDSFLKAMHTDIQWYIDDLLGKIEWDRWERYDKGTWIEKKYKELLSEDGASDPKQEAVVEKVGAKGKVLQILDWVQGK